MRPPPQATCARFGSGPIAGTTRVHWPSDSLSVAAVTPSAYRLGMLRAAAKRGRAELDALVEQAVVDAYDEYEQLTAFHAAIESYLAVPFQTTVLGVEVTVTKIDLLPGSGVVAICTRAKHRQAIGVLDLPLPTPPPVAKMATIPLTRG